MQIVIEIDEISYKWIKDTSRNMNNFDFIDAVKNSIVLPKGHGGLVDRKMVHKAVMDELWGTGNARQTLLVVDSEFYVTTIIPADKGDE